MEKISRLLPRLYLPLLLLLVAAYAWRPIEGGFDFWAHAAVGRWIWDHGRVPHATLFIWSEPHTPWIAHSWLSQLLFYLLLAHGGVLGVAIFNVALPVAVFFCLWRLWMRQAEANFLVPLLFALAIWASAPRFQPRQELISVFFLAVLLAFLIAWSQGRFDDWIARRDSAHLSLIAAPMVTLFFFWVNLHALMAVGLAVLWIAVIGEAVQAWLGRSGSAALNRARARTLFVIAILCSLTTLLNPFGIAYWEAVGPLKPDNMAKYIEEWRPFWQVPDTGWNAAVEAILCIAALIAWRVNPQSRWMNLGWLIFGAVLSMRSVRMFWISAVLFLAVLAVNAIAFDSPTLWRSWRRLIRGNILEPIPPRLRIIARSGAILILVAWLGAAVSRHVPDEAGTWKTLVRNTPEGAARRILSGRLPRRIFNDYEDSSYLQWRVNGFDPTTHHVPTRGRFPLFIDLLNAYPDRLVSEYLAILKASPQGVKRLKMRRINCVVLGDHHWDSGLAKYLERHRMEWKRVFKDQQSMIWVRKMHRN
jgi:hypothetical protein